MERLVMVQRTDREHAEGPFVPFKARYGHKKALRAGVPMLEE
jgi:hypothetical protein